MLSSHEETDQPPAAAVAVSPTSTVQEDVQQQQRLQEKISDTSGKGEVSFFCFEPDGFRYDLSD